MEECGGGGNDLVEVVDGVLLQGSFTAVLPEALAQVACMHAWVGGWLVGWVGGWLVGWVGGRMIDGWMMDG